MHAPTPSKLALSMILNQGECKCCATHSLSGDSRNLIAYFRFRPRPKFSSAPRQAHRTVGGLQHRGDASAAPAAALLSSMRYASGLVRMHVLRRVRAFTVFRQGGMSELYGQQRRLSFKWCMQREGARCEVHAESPGGRNFFAILRASARVLAAARGPDKHHHRSARTPRRTCKTAARSTCRRPKCAAMHAARTAPG